MPKPRDLEVSNVFLAAFLSVRGFPFKASVAADWRGGDGRKVVVFVFPESPELDAAIREYSADGKVSARRFVAALHKCRALITSRAAAR